MKSWVLMEEKIVVGRRSCQNLDNLTTCEKGAGLRTCSGMRLPWKLMETCGFVGALGPEREESTGELDIARGGLAGLGLYVLGS